MNARASPSPAAHTGEFWPFSPRAWGLGFLARFGTIRAMSWSTRERPQPKSVRLVLLEEADVAERIHKMALHSGRSLSAEV